MPVRLDIKDPVTSPRPAPQPPSSQWGSLLRWEGQPREGTAGGMPARQPRGACPFKHEPYHLGSPTPSVLLALPAWRGVLETFLELIQQPSRRVVLGTALLLGGGGLMLWMQRKRRRKKDSETAQDEQEPPESDKARKESWIKSHFSCFSEEKLAAGSNPTCSHSAGACSSGAAAQPESGSGEASTTIRVDTFTTRQGEEGTALHREPLTSKQRMSGTSVTKETHEESGKSSSTDEATWAAVAACTKEIDTKGQQLAISMLQHATACQNSGHLESKDISQEELKALEEVEMKLKGNFLTQQETTTAGANHTHTFHSHCHHGHQGYPSHPCHSLPNSSHQAYQPFKAT
ncbi:uncharacterized protein C10orf62 homolog [Delphinapterus leucas]|uniref:Uncharacterized protein C10orf62 homolog n=1 Tax=Delphinapterus leucas TaxID=9749 RepID=A0A2Y9MS76_DELLE|nr:uncharacterized protein C10orf62 homolog [Delphinapterus leucas]